jgi:hypothetical protein
MTLIHAVPYKNTPEVQALITKGAPFVVWGSDRATSRLPSMKVEAESATMVSQREYALCSPNIKDSGRCLVTYGLSPCVAILAYNEESKVALLAHADTPKGASDILNKVVPVMGRGRLTIYGGSSCNYETLCAIYGALKTNAALKSFRVSYNTKIGGDEMREVGIDASDGHLFIPDSSAMKDNFMGQSARRTSLISSGRFELEYVGRAPLEAFKNLLRETSQGSRS